MRDGRLVSIENVSDLKFKKVRHMELSLSHEVSLDELKIEGVEILSVKDTIIKLKVSGNLPNLLKQICKLPIEDMAFPEATLEDTFMEFYGEVQE